MNSAQHLVRGNRNYGTSQRFLFVTVSYNQGQFIRQNIESVLAQDYPNFEHIVGMRVHRRNG